jgi:hypothetical protein
MRRMIGIDVHRTFGEVVFWENGRFRHASRIDMTRTALEGFARTLLASDEVLVEATANSMAVSRVLAPFVARGDYRQSVAGEGDCPGSRKDRQDRCRHARQFASGEVTAADLDA